MAEFSVNRAWEETSAFLAREARLVAPIAMALIAVPAAIQGWINPASDETPTPFISLIVMLISLAGQMAIAQLAIGWTASIGEAIGKGARRMWLIVGAGLLIYFPLVLVAVTVLIASLGMEGLGRLSTMSPAEMAEVPAVALILLATIAVALFLSARLLPMVGVAMAEEVGVIGLLRRSWGMTKGNLGKLLGVILLLAVASLLLNGAVVVVVGALATFLLGPATSMSVSALLIGLAVGIVSALIAATYSALIGRIYVQLKSRDALAA